jgi:hypothetical protein
MSSLFFGSQLDGHPVARAPSSLFFGSQLDGHPVARAPDSGPGHREERDQQTKLQAAEAEVDSLRVKMRYWRCRTAELKILLRKDKQERRLHRSELRNARADQAITSWLSEDSISPELCSTTSGASSSDSPAMMSDVCHSVSATTLQDACRSASAMMSDVCRSDSSAMMSDVCRNATSDANSSVSGPPLTASVVQVESRGETALRALATLKDQVQETELAHHRQELAYRENFLDLRALATNAISRNDEVQQGAKLEVSRMRQWALDRVEKAKELAQVFMAQNHLLRDKVNTCTSSGEERDMLKVQLAHIEQKKRALIEQQQCQRKRHQSSSSSSSQFEPLHSSFSQGSSSSRAP